MNNFSNKDPGETIIATFDFSDELASTDPLLSSGITVTVALTRGVDASPSNILFGAPIVVGGRSITQAVRGGVAGCNYRLTCTASSASETLVRAGLLRVRNAT